ncbi:Fanconi anemia core complex-associated protein 20 isoform X3 [Pan troglodytes]|uniref:Fanconi anemia core complex-associated protein 20 isoform X3 n=1 Tax=Pan troglodytes TaxID=9598 RepID=UPI0023EF9400|nr:Fanconi anemia core complex-associated protein 20 isoform X1 [Pan troglodytes]
MCGPEHLLCCPKDLAMFPRQLSLTACLPGTPVSHKCHHIWLWVGVPAWHPRASRCGGAQPSSWLRQKAARAFWLSLPAAKLRHHSSRWLRRSGAFSSGSTLKPPPPPSPAPLCRTDNLRTGRTRPSGGRPWFLLGGEERERLWAELLRTVSPELILDHEVPSLPAFPGQEPRCGPEPTEVFTVGTKTFSWTPFPPDLWGPGRSYRLLHGAGGHLESPARSLPQRPAPDPCRAPRVEQQPSVEGAAALRSCPMCQKEFAPRLTQLDVDSHLAQCLAESTEDVMW